MTKIGNKVVLGLCLAGLGVALAGCASIQTRTYDGTDYEVRMSAAGEPTAVRVNGQWYECDGSGNQNCERVVAALGADSGTSAGPGDMFGNPETGPGMGHGGGNN